MHKTEFRPASLMTALTASIICALPQASLADVPDIPPPIERYTGGLGIGAVIAILITLLIITAGIIYYMRSHYSPQKGSEEQRPTPAATIPSASSNVPVQVPAEAEAML